MHAGVRPHMHLDLDAPRRMSSLRREQLAFAHLSRIIHRIRGQARGARPPNFPLSPVNYAAKLDIHFSVLHVRSHTVVSVCMADSIALSTLLDISLVRSEF